MEEDNSVVLQSPHHSFLPVALLKIQVFKEAKTKKKRCKHADYLHLTKPGH